MYGWTQGWIRGVHPPPLKLEKIWFFCVKSWFFTRNTPKKFAPPSTRHDFFSVHPPNLKSWIIGSGRRGSNHYANGICNFSSKQASLRSQSKDWLAQNQDNVSEWHSCLCSFQYNLAVVHQDYIFYLFLERVQINCIFSDNVHIVCLYLHNFYVPGWLNELGRWI